MDAYDPNRSRGGALPLHEAQGLLKDYLLPGERLLWAGRPPRGVRLSAADAFIIPFSLLWSGFAVFWTLGAWWGGAPGLFVAFGFPFVAVGLYLIFGRFFHDAWRRGRTLYAVSSQRVLVLRGDRLVGRDIGRLATLEIEQRGAGRGTIRFEPSPFPAESFAGRSRVAVTSRDDGFYEIEQPRTVYDLIRREADRHRADPPPP